MEKQVEKASIDHAWMVLLGVSLCMFCGTPSVVFYTFGIFLPDIISDTGWPAASVAAAIGPGALIVALTAPIVGKLSDRFGVKPLAMIGGPCFGLGIALLGIVPDSARAFTLVTMLMYLLAFSGSPIIYAHALTGWFDKRRGFALGVMFCVGALGIAAWPPYAAMLIENFGWRQAFGVMGATAGTVIFLAGLLLLKNPPLLNGRTDSNLATALPPPGIPVGEALRTASFWKTAIIFCLLSAVLGGMAVQFPVVLRHQGADAQMAASAITVVGVTMFLGRFLLGLVLDRWFAPHITIGITAISMLAFAIMSVSSGHTALFLAAGFVGFGIGSEYAVAAYFVSRLFGFRAYGAIYGLITLATGVGLAVGPATMGVSLAKGISLEAISLVCIVVLAIPMLLLLTLKKSDLAYGPSPTA